MKRTTKVLSLIVALALCLSNMVYASAETKNRSIKGVWKLIDIEIAYQQNGLSITVNKKSITEKKDISVSFKDKNYTLCINDENHSEKYFGAYQADESTLTVHAEEDYEFSYYVISDILTLINDNQTFTFRREGASQDNVYRGGKIEGRWRLTNSWQESEHWKEKFDDDFLLLSEIVGTLLVATFTGISIEYVDLEFQNNTLALTIMKANGEEDTSIVGTYWTAGTMIYLSHFEQYTNGLSDEFLCYNVDGDMLGIGNDVFRLEFTRQ